MEQQVLRTPELLRIITGNLWFIDQLQLESTCSTLRPKPLGLTTLRDICRRESYIDLIHYAGWKCGHDLMRAISDEKTTAKTAFIDVAMQCVTGSGNFFDPLCYVFSVYANSNIITAIADQVLQDGIEHLVSASRILTRVFTVGHSDRCWEYYCKTAPHESRSMKLFHDPTKQITKMWKLPRGRVISHIVLAWLAQYDNVVLLLRYVVNIGDHLYDLIIERVIGYNSTNILAYIKAPHPQHYERYARLKLLADRASDTTKSMFYGACGYRYDDKLWARCNTVKALQSVLVDIPDPQSAYNWYVNQTNEKYMSHLSYLLGTYPAIAITSDHLVHMIRMSTTSACHTTMSVRLFRILIAKLPSLDSVYTYTCANHGLQREYEQAILMETADRPQVLSDRNIIYVRYVALCSDNLQSHQPSIFSKTITAMMPLLTRDQVRSGLELVTSSHLLDDISRYLLTSH